VTDGPARDVLPIPDRAYVGLTTYDAKDPDTAYPPIRDIRPPAACFEAERGGSEARRNAASRSGEAAFLLAT